MYNTNTRKDAEHKLTGKAIATFVWVEMNE